MRAMTKITVADLNLNTPNTVATDRTLDQTQRKHLLVYPGQARFAVTRKYLDDRGTDIEVQTIYDGSDLNEAIRLYNGLS